MPTVPRDSNRPFHSLAEEPLAPPPRSLGARGTASVAMPAHYPVVGVTALDAMAAIAGPVWAVDHERAWNAAFEIVVGAMLSGGTEADRQPRLEPERSRDKACAWPPRTSTRARAGRPTATTTRADAQR